MSKSWNEISEIVNIELEKLSWSKEPQGLYSPIQYVMSLGGKRIRPALTLMSCNIFSDDFSQAIAPALGLEVFHNFTLLHDDIMDKAPIRRGKDTVHIKWNDNTAILSGDVMQIEAFKLMTLAPDIVLKEVLNLFTQTAAEICEGQQYDTEFEQRNEVAAEEYIEMIRLKTAVLLGCALKTGAIIGGANSSDAQHLYDFGINVGLAFQLKDDLLDVYGDEEKFGKKIGGDILSNKKTYLLIQALKNANPNQKEQLNYWLEQINFNPEKKIKDITDLFNSIGVKKICEEIMTDYYCKAVANLENVQVESSKKEELRNLAEKLMSRID